ncbi:hypothetical protein PQX77_020027 [Marasmius sp. AFHP31]|nr:hypothetical protein PQX77_020027 [Marasmius sp. AFHP31]
MECCSQHEGVVASDARQYRLKMLKVVYGSREIDPNKIIAVLSLKVPPSSSMDPSHPSEEARQVLSAITTVAGPIQQQIPAMLNQFSMLQKLWPLITSWTIALLKSFVLDGSPTTPLGVEFRELLIFGSCSVSRLLQHTSHPDSACKQTPTFIPTILTVVLHLAQTSHPAFETMWSELSKVIECRESLLQFRSSIAYLRKQHNVPRLITRMIQTECGNSYIDTWTLDSCMGFITHCLAYAPELNRPLRATNIVRWITHALSRIAAKRNSIREGDLEVACPCLIYCCDYLKQAFGDGFFWVSQALDGRVVLSMVKLLGLSNHPILLAGNSKPDLLR